MPMNRTKNIPDKATSGFTLLYKRFVKHLPDEGFFILLGAMTFLAFIASYDFSPKVYIVNEGDVAVQDVMADRNILIDDKEATQGRQEKIRAMQPLVCDLVLTPISLLRSKVQSVFIAINQTDESGNWEEIQQKLEQEQPVDISLDDLAIFKNVHLQILVMDDIIPFLQHQLSQGVLSDMRAVLSYRGGILINNVQTGNEKLILDVDSVRDVKSIENLLSQKLTSLKLSTNEKRAAHNLLMLFIVPTLTPDRKSTRLNSSHL